RRPALPPGRPRIRSHPQFFDRLFGQGRRACLQNLTMKKILIVEDDQIVANVYRNKFSVDGFQVEVALDGQAGLELTRSFRPDAIILDLMLPKMSGVELMKQLRSEPEFQHLPVIVFSNTYLTNMVQEAWKAGATKCLSKANCSPKQVIEVVRNAITNGAANVAAAAAALQPQVTEPAGPVDAEANRVAPEQSEEEFQA